MRRILASTIVVFLLLCTWSPAAFAKEPATPEFTLNDAIECALKQSEDIKSAEVNIDKSWEQREDAADNVNYTPTFTGGGPVLPEVEAAFSGLVKADLAWRVKKKDLDAKEEQVALNTYKAYVGILQAKEAVDNAKITLARDEKLLLNARTSQRVGLVALTDIVGAEAKVNASRAALAAAQESLDKAYITFNRLVGLWPVDRPVLADKIEFSLLQADVIDAEAERAVENSKDIWKLEQNITIEKLDLDFLTLSYDVEKKDVESAKITLEGAKKATREATYSLYKDIKALEETQVGLASKVRVAEEALRVANVKFNAGMITKTDLVVAEATLAEAQKALQDVTYQHANLKASFRVLTGRPILEDKSV